MSEKRELAVKAVSMAPVTATQCTFEHLHRDINTIEKRFRSTST